MLRQRNYLITQPFGFNVMGLQHNQPLKIRMHSGPSFHSAPSQKQLFSGGKLKVQHSRCSSL
jgi:hypothetical protein